MGVRHSGNDNGRTQYGDYGGSGAVGFDDAVGYDGAAGYTGAVGYDSMAVSIAYDVYPSYGGYTESVVPPVPLPPVATAETAESATSMEPAIVPDSVTIPDLTVIPDTGARQKAAFTELSGVRGSDRDERFSDRARHGRPRLRFGATQALAAILIMVMVTCASLTLLIRQAVNYAAVEAASSAQTTDSGSESGDATDSAGDATDSGDGATSGDAAAGRDAAPGSDDAGTTRSETPQPTSEPQAQQPEQPVDTRVDLNTATLEQLDAIPGIGPVTAQKILDHRVTIGRYSSVDQLLDVPGIGVKTLEKIRPEVKV